MVVVCRLQDRKSTPMFSALSIAVVLLLGHPDFRVRQAATRSGQWLRLQGCFPWEVVLWAKKSADADVRHRAKMIELSATYFYLPHAMRTHP